MSDEKSIASDFLKAFKAYTGELPPMDVALARAIFDLQEEIAALREIVESHGKRIAYHERFHQIYRG